MNEREKIISAIEKAKKQSEEYAQDRIIVPFKKADMILALLKEQGAKPVDICGQITIKYGHCPNCGEGLNSETYPHWCGFCGQEMKWE